MKKGTIFLESEVKRVCRNKIIIAATLLLMVVVLLTNVKINLSNLYGKGIEFWDYNQTLEDFDSGKRYIDNLYGHMVYDTGYYYTDPVTYYYLVGLVDGSQYTYIIYQTEKQFTDVEMADYINISGKLKPLTELSSELRGKVVSDLSGYGIDISNVFIVNGDTTKTWDLVWVTAAMIGALLLIVYIALQVLSIMNYQRHKLLRKIERINGLTLSELEDKLALDEFSEPIIDKRGFMVTPMFVYNTSMFGFKIRLVNDLMWVYRITTQHKTYGITTGRSHSLQLWFHSAKGDNINVSLSERASINVIEQLAISIDTAMYGYSDDLRRLYMKDYDEFTALWERHKTGLIIDDYADEETSQDDVDSNSDIVQE